MRRRAVARGLNQPREVHDGVDTAEAVGQIVLGDVGRHPARARQAELRPAPCDPDDLGHLRVV